MLTYNPVQPALPVREKPWLLILLLVVWLIPGLLGHDPWRQGELPAMGVVVDAVQGAPWWRPSIGGEPAFWMSPWLTQGSLLWARLGQGVLGLSLAESLRLMMLPIMALILLLTGACGHELWGRRHGRTAMVLLIGCIGLLPRAHQFNPNVMTLLGYAACAYAWIMAPRHVWRHAFILHFGVLVFAATGGLSDILLPLVMSALLPVFLPKVRTWRYLLATTMAWALGGLLWGVWPLYLWLKQPQSLVDWWVGQDFLTGNQWLLGYGWSGLADSLQRLIWIAWPVWPLALWGLWFQRQRLRDDKRWLVLCVWLILGAVFMVLHPHPSDVQALPLLLPLVFMAAAKLDDLPRGAANALHWFGLFAISMATVYLWVMWGAMMTGQPQRLALHLQKLNPSFVATLNPWLVVLAGFLTLCWLLGVMRPRAMGWRAISNWALGLSLVWSLLMTLWLPWLDASKSYRRTMQSLAQVLPHQACVQGWGFSPTQRAALDYYLQQDLQAYRGPEAACPWLLLAADSEGQRLRDWALVWEGGRPGEYRERFRLYHAQP